MHLIPQHFDRRSMPRPHFEIKVNSIGLLEQSDLLIIAFGLPNQIAFIPKSGLDRDI